MKTVSVTHRRIWIAKPGVGDVVFWSPRVLFKGVVKTRAEFRPEFTGADWHAVDDLMAAVAIIERISDPYSAMSRVRSGHAADIRHRS